jgi:hypothetical protein
MSFKEMLRLSSAARKTSGRKVSLKNLLLTFGELSTIKLSCLKLNSNDMSKRLMQELHGNTETCRHRFRLLLSTTQRPGQNTDMCSVCNLSRDPRHAAPNPAEIEIKPKGVERYELATWRQCSAALTMVLEAVSKPIACGGAMPPMNCGGGK